MSKGLITPVARRKAAIEGGKKNTEILRKCVQGELTL